MLSGVLNMYLTFTLHCQMTQPNLTFRSGELLYCFGALALLRLP
jgi:hypothetical protein